MVKLCVGARSIADLKAWQDARIAAQRADGVSRARPYHITRFAPKRAEELLDGGSLYWVIQGLVQVRQRIVGFDEVRVDDGAKCRISFDRKLIETELAPRKAFQGWRYLTEEDAPADLSGRDETGAGLPPQIRSELIAIGAW